MFDKYIVVEDTLRRTADGGSIEVRMPYYRGLFLSMVEAVDLTIDGLAVPAADTTFTVHGNTYPFPELPGITDDRWEMGEPAVLAFRLADPLTDGDHEIAIRIRLRISYMPVPGGGADRKTLTVQGAP